MGTKKRGSTNTHTDYEKNTESTIYKPKSSKDEAVKYLFFICLIEFMNTVSQLHSHSINGYYYSKN